MIDHNNFLLQVKEEYEELQILKSQLESALSTAPQGSLLTIKKKRNLKRKSKERENANKKELQSIFEDTEKTENIENTENVKIAKNVKNREFAEAKILQNKGTAKYKELTEAKILQNKGTAKYKELTETKILQNKGTAKSKELTETKNFQNSSAYIEYYWYHNRKNCEYIKKKDHNLAIMLAQKGYHIEALKVVNNRIDACLQLIQKYDTSFEQIYEQTQESKKILITPLMLSDEAYIKEWYQNNKGGQNNYPIATEYYTDKGEIVRSKSEKILADLFNKLGIPYVYEPLIIMESGAMVYPDFLLLNVRLRKNVIFEHFGLMGDSTYSERVCQKIALYEKNNYMPGDRFIFTMESTSHSLDTRMVEKLLEKYVR